MREKAWWVWNWGKFVVLIDQVAHRHEWLHNVCRVTPRALLRGTVSTLHMNGPYDNVAQTTQEKELVGSWLTVPCIQCTVKEAICCGWYRRLLINHIFGVNNWLKTIHRRWLSQQGNVTNLHHTHSILLSFEGTRDIPTSLSCITYTVGNNNVQCKVRVVGCVRSVTSHTHTQRDESTPLRLGYVQYLACSTPPLFSLFLLFPQRFFICVAGRRLSVCVQRKFISYFLFLVRILYFLLYSGQSQVLYFL